MGINIGHTMIILTDNGLKVLDLIKRFTGLLLDFKGGIIEGRRGEKQKK